MNDDYFVDIVEQLTFVLLSKNYVRNLNNCFHHGDNTHKIIL